MTKLQCTAGSRFLGAWGSSMVAAFAGLFLAGAAVVDVSKPLRPPFMLSFNEFAFPMGLLFEFNYFFC
jgi:hypothetical protein